jgi:peptidoglycan hydrolase-like amidase
MCQWGAAGWARAGADYLSILSRYYPGAEITRMY